MTLLEPPPNRQQSPPPRRRAGGALIIVLMIVSFVATGATREWAMNSQELASRQGDLAPMTSSANSLSAMPSYATALLLGGLRGPLVMFLWPTSESHKQQHNLEDVDTEIEWIRLLQPEFDTVHLFQIWNKAYNLSVQMSSLHDKYTTILDGIEYGRKVDLERPDDISILGALAAVWGDKLSASTEHVYYRQRVRRESQTLYRLEFPESMDDQFRAAAFAVGWVPAEAPVADNVRTHRMTVFLEPLMYQRLANTFSGPDISAAPENFDTLSQNPSWRAEQLAPMLDVNGNLLPEYTHARFPRPGPAEVDPNSPYYDGSALQFLEPFGPFHYGLPPAALAYNEYKRAQMLEVQWKERNIQLGDSAVDSRPGITEKIWAIDEWERGRRAEIRMWAARTIDGQVVTQALGPDLLEYETQSIPWTRPVVVNDGSLEAALDAYSLGTRLMVDSMRQLREHCVRFPETAQTFAAHVDDAISGAYFLQADYDYLAAMHAQGDDQKKLLDSAADNYAKAQQHYAMTVLKYYIDDEVMLKLYPKTKNGQTYLAQAIELAGLTDYMPLVQQVRQANIQRYTDPKTGKYDSNTDPRHTDTDPYYSNIDRCGARLDALKGH